MSFLCSNSPIHSTLSSFSPPPSLHSVSFLLCLVSSYLSLLAVTPARRNTRNLTNDIAREVDRDKGIDKRSIRRKTARSNRQDEDVNGSLWIGSFPRDMFDPRTLYCESSQTTYFSPQYNVSLILLSAYNLVPSSSLSFSPFVISKICTYLDVFASVCARAARMDSITYRMILLRDRIGFAVSVLCDLMYVFVL